jgi:phosphatidylglycerol:prolipoprotein diacylglycerol transferase
VKPIPVVFHLGPLQIHTYGIGLTITFYLAYRYYARRLRDHGYPTEWLTSAFVWIIVASLVGARLVHVLANIGFYEAEPGQILQVWHGGLSSYGGLALGIPVGFLLARRRCPELPSGIAADLLAPVLVGAWAIGRLLGPQLMVAGGGHPTTAWYGMYYAGQVGRRVPVPLLQAAECAVIFVILLAVERRLVRRGARPVGFLAALAVCLWNASRISDEYFFLSYPGHTGAIAVEVGAIALTVIGAAVAGWLWWRDRGHAPPPAEVVGADRTVGATQRSSGEGPAWTSPS